MNISGKTTVVGLIGYPVSHSFSPRMHNAAAQDANVDLVYIPLSVKPGLEGDAVRGLRGLGFRGANVTIPHKQAIMPFLDEVDEAATLIGAVNTILVEEDGRMRGTNTDWSGFSADLAAKKMSAENRQCIVLGAGGSARAIVYALMQQNATIHLFSRRAEQSAELAQTFIDNTGHAAIFPHTLPDLIDFDFDQPLVINTTPLGMSPKVERTPWPADLSIPSGADVYDLVYTPAETMLMKQATAANCRAANGLGMLLWQGAQAFEHWMGVMPDLDVMEQALGIS